MGITYAGFELLLPDRIDGFCVVQKWLDDFLSIEGMRIFAPPHADCLPSRSADNGQHPLPVCRINYPEPPPLRLNSLYWPTGASRFSRGLFMCHRTTKDKIVNAVRSSNRIFAAADFRFTNSLDGTELLKTSLHLLDPIPVTTYKSADGSETVLRRGDESLWLLPLVDGRYYGQQVMPEDGIDTADHDWQNWLKGLANIINLGPGGTVNMDAADSAYLKPDRVEMLATDGSAAMLLDAGAHSVGCRVVRQLDGSWDVATTSGANTKYAGNFDNGKWQQIAGEQHDIDSAKENDLPAAIRMGARRSSYGRIFNNGGETEFDTDRSVAADYAYYTTLASGSGSATAAIEVATTALADIADIAMPGGVPSNNTHLGDLATKIKTDWYAWRRSRFDFTFAGVFKWTMSGYEDYVEYRYGTPGFDKDGKADYQSSTRIVSMPPDVGTKTMYHCDSSLTFGNLDSPQLGRVYDTFISGGTPGLVELFKRNLVLDSGFRVKASVWPYSGGANCNKILKNQPVILFWSRNMNRWYALPASPNNVYWGSATTNWKKTGGGSGSGLVPYVAVRVVDGAEGTSANSTMFTDFDINVLLPRPIGRFGDPNVVAGDIVAFSITSSGEAVCVSDYMDGRIGEIRWTATGTPNTNGWGIANGTNNSTANKGSNLNLMSAYIYTGTTPHATETKTLTGHADADPTAGSAGVSVDIPRATLTPFERLDNSS